MRITPKTPAKEIHQKACGLYRYRLGAIFLLALFAVIVHSLGFFEINPWLLGLVILIEILINCPYKVLYRNSCTGFWVLVTSVTFDFLCGVATLFLLGNVEFLAYSTCLLITIVYAAVNLPTRLILFWFATLASLLYTGLFVVKHASGWEQIVVLISDWNTSHQTTILISHITFLCLISLVVKSLGDALTRKEERLRSSLWELRETHERVKYAHLLLSVYFSHMNHEIRAALNTILGFSELLIENPGGSITEKQKDFLTRIRNSGKYLRDLIAELFDFSKTELKKMQFSPKQLDIAKVIESVLDVFQEEATQKKLRLYFSPKTKGVKILADEFRLRHVLYNLISNALKFTPQGSIRVGLEKKDLGIQITVEDSGPGITPENLETIFRPYQPNGDAVAKKILGKGLGLAICKQFVEIHSGKIRVESEIGKGSHFIINFPYKLPEPPPEKPIFSFNKDSVA